MILKQRHCEKYDDEAIAFVIPECFSAQQTGGSTSLIGGNRGSKISGFPLKSSIQHGGSATMFGGDCGNDKRFVIALLSTIARNDDEIGGLNRLVFIINYNKYI